MVSDSVTMLSHAEVDKHIRKVHIGVSPVKRSSAISVAHRVSYHYVPASNQRRPINKHRCGPSSVVQTLLDNPDLPIRNAIRYARDFDVPRLYLQAQIVSPPSNE